MTSRPIVGLCVLTGAIGSSASLCSLRALDLKVLDEVAAPHMVQP